MASGPIKPIAMYFPQLHRIPENDAWWGPGFTDWDNVRSAQPLYDGHDQPRVPLHGRYYDQSLPETQEWQAELARRAGIHGFCIYHYWFDGKLLLEKPAENLLRNRHIDLPFCLCWANETWSRRWDGKDNRVLIRQTHPPEPARWQAHFDYLLPFLSDERAIRVDGKPMLVLYRPQNINRIDDMVDFWREAALRSGLDGLYLVIQKSFEYPRSRYENCADALFQFQPFETIHSPGFTPQRKDVNLLKKLFSLLPESVQDEFRTLRAMWVNQPEFYDYDTVMEYAVRVRNDPDLTTFPGIFCDWDNTARYKGRARIFRGASPERFAHWLDRLCATMPERQLPENFFFINAWNEWAECAYLEPDETHGVQYLDALKAVLARHGTHAPAPSSPAA